MDFRGILAESPLNVTTVINNCYGYFGNVTERHEFIGKDFVMWEVIPARLLQRKSNIWLGDDIFKYSLPVFLAQVSITALVTSTMEFLLKPIGVTSFVAQMIGGIITGPSGVGQSWLMATKIFTYSSLYILETVQYFGSMFFLFLIGVKSDMGMVKRSGKMAWLVGFLSFCLPVILSSAVAFITVSRNHTFFSPEAAGSFFAIAGLTSVSSPHVINDFLSDLKLLNSELGRIAVSASMVSGCCSLLSVFLVLTIVQSRMATVPYSFFLTILSCLLIVIVILYVIRPIMFWINKHTADNTVVKEGYLIFIFLTVLVSSLLGEIVGQHYLVGPLLLGLVVPPGPPLGAAIENKLECFVTSILVPVIVIARACVFQVHDIRMSTFSGVLLISLFSFFGKLLGTLIPAFYSGMPYQDAIILGLIMNVQGVLDIQIWVRTISLGLITRELYGCLVLAMVIFTGSISIIVKYFYDPSSKYASYRRKTIQHSKPNAELRILACVYHEENVPSIVKLLEASNATTYSPICVYALHLVQLQGRATPLLIAHKTRPRSENSDMDPTTRIIMNSFSLYAHHNRGIVSLNSFTAISPYNIMHEDVCSLGFDKRTSLIIIPFHHQHPAILSKSVSSSAIRRVNMNILKKAPCSVGILIDKGETRPSTLGGMSNSSSPVSKVLVIFLSGPDDREALAYGTRIGDDVNVNLTVIRFMKSDDRMQQQRTKEKKLDDDSIYAFRHQTAGFKNVEYIEQGVKDGADLISSIKEMESSFELVIVGRDQGQESTKLFAAFSEWNEFPELGVMGDMLVSSDSKASGCILVMQQRPTKEEERIQKIKSLK
ncbi:hypothetical protein MKW92_041385 [Papaver armeniacum]|nr:hypothetical protein MKW92_041385 [Papaver armeniacum]